jgi:Predicted transcriptional regulators
MSEAELREKTSAQVAKILKELRKERGLSMTELAARSGLSRAMISFIENELRNPTLDTLLRIAAVLNVELADVLRDARKSAKSAK